MFIVIDGPDFTGKSTVVKLLAEKLKELGMDVVTCNDPNSDLPFSKNIRQFLLNKTEECDLAELLMFCAARAELNEKIIRPALNAKKIVICDRYLPSSIAYQIYGRDNDEFLYLAADSHWTIHSNITFMLSVDDEARAARMASRGDKIDEIDKMPNEFFDRVRKGYSDFVAAEKIPTRTDRIVSLDTSNATPDEVVAEMVRQLILSKR